jgi:molybdenum cofactor guanylyltransferase
MPIREARFCPLTSPLSSRKRHFDRSNQRFSGRAALAMRIGPRWRADGNELMLVLLDIRIPAEGEPDDPCGVGAMVAMIESTVGVLLAGGRSRRMGGGDKPLLLIAGKPLLVHAIERMEPQCEALMVNANGVPDRFFEYGLPVIADSVEGFAGPLAGVLAGLDWVARHHRGVPWLVSIAADTPFLPRDLVTRLHEARAAKGARLACAASGERIHPVIGLWPIDMREELRHALVVEGTRRVDEFTARYPLAVVEWRTEPYDPFFNANAPEDLAEAAKIARLAIAAAKR